MGHPSSNEALEINWKRSDPTQRWPPAIAADNNTEVAVLAMTNTTIFLVSLAANSGSALLIGMR